MRFSKKVIYPILILFIVLLVTVLGIIFLKGDTAANTVNAYRDKWQKKDYKGMYDILDSKTKAKITEQQFVDRYTSIYNGIEAENISINLEENKKINTGTKNNIKIPFSIIMNTAAGPLKLSGYELNMVKEKVNGKKQWLVEWDEKLIFPNMIQGDKVKVDIFNPKRGEIYDRNGKGLAINSTIITIGIHPSKFEQNKSSNILEMAKILDIDSSLIENKLKASSNPEQFVPIVNIASSEKEKIAGVMKINGVIHQKVEGRVYPGGEAFGSLIGYIAPITSEELEKLKTKDYSSNSLIGKAGLEQVYEKRLKGEKGAEIYISRQKDGKQAEKISILKKEAKNGDNVKLCVDLDLQKKIYEEMSKNGGACSAINPQNGEILALVSSPSYDSNAFTTYATKSQKAAWKNGNKDPFQNRFKVAYAPGSTIKMMTAAIGLNEGKINPNEAINIQGKAWQPNKSWGNYKVTRVSDTGKPVNLKDAFIYSDNIYFAMVALNVGKEAFIKESKNFGFDEVLPIDYPIAKSQIANDNNIKSDILLADSGYGQGQMLISPLHLALIYSSVVNEGNIMTPLLEVSGNASPKVWKERAIAKENVGYILDGLTAVVESSNGTAHEAKINGLTLAGKTGTAELKKNNEDKNAEEYGWFVCMNTENPKVVLSMIVEDTKTRGGSHYVVPIVKNVMNYYLNSSK